jgi:DNA polymerase III subunit chi
MTEVKFFFNAEHKLQFACKLAKTVADGGKRLVVFAPDEGVASELDRLLWTFSALSFVPHVRATHALAAQTPIVIAGTESALPHHDALLNLSDEPPPFFTRFVQLREIVSLDAEDRSRARTRLKFYKDRGFDILTHDLAAKAATTVNAASATNTATSA